MMSPEKIELNIPMSSMACCMVAPDSLLIFPNKAASAGWLLKYTPERETFITVTIIALSIPEMKPCLKYLSPAYLPMNQAQIMKTGVPSNASNLAGTKYMVAVPMSRPASVSKRISFHFMQQEYSGVKVVKNMPPFL